MGVNLLRIFKTPFPENTSERLLLSYPTVDRNCLVEFLPWNLHCQVEHHQSKRYNREYWLLGECSGMRQWPQDVSKPSSFVEILDTPLNTYLFRSSPPLGAHIKKCSENIQPFKNDEKCFLFHLKSSFRSQDIVVFLLTLWSCRKTAWLERSG